MRGERSRRPSRRGRKMSRSQWQKFAEASARVGRLEAALKVLGEEDPDAEPLKAALKQARIHARVDCPGQETTRASRGTVSRSRGSPEADGGEARQRVAGFGGLAGRGVTTASDLPRPEYPTTGDGGGTQRGNHQIAGTSGRAPFETPSDPRSRVNPSEEGKNNGRPLLVLNLRPEVVSGADVPC